MSLVWSFTTAYGIYSSIWTSFLSQGENYPFHMLFLFSFRLCPIHHVSRQLSKVQTLKLQTMNNNLNTKKLD